MADPISFDPFLGWVDIADPNSVPQDARIITAADLIRYEQLGIAATGAINNLIDEVNGITTTPGGGGGGGSGHILNAASYGTLDPTGVANASTTLQAALNAVPDGGELYIPPGRYRVTSTPTISGKTITLHAHGVTIINATASGPAIEFKGGMGTIYTVSAITASTVTIDGNAVPTLQLTTNAASGYEVGEVVKLVADDAIPGGKAVAGGQVARVGEFLTIHSSSGTTVTALSDGLYDPFTTNIRVAKFLGKTVTIHGLTITTDTAVSTDGMGIRIFEMVNPTLNNVTIEKSMGAAYTMVGCYGYSINNGIVGYGANTGEYGYGVNDTGCWFGKVNGLIARHVRHAYTDGTNQIAANSSQLHQYGRTVSAHIDNSSAHATSGSGWDTHQYSRDVRFTNTTSYDSGSAGFALRGVGHTIVNCRAVNARVGLLVFCASGSDEWSHSHTIDGLTLENSRLRSIEWIVNKLTNALETRASRADNLRVLGNPANGIIITNAAINMGSFEVVSANLTVGGSKVVNLTNTDINVDAFRTHFAGQTTSMSGTLPVILSGGAKFRVADWKNTFGGNTNSGRFSYFVDTSGGVAGTTTNLLQVDKLVSDFMCSVDAIPWADSGGDTYINYKGLKTSSLTASSTFVDYTNANITTAQMKVNKSTDEVITLGATLTASMNLFTMRGGRFVGQTIRLVYLDGTGTLTVRTGTTYGVQTISGANVNLTVGQSMTLTWVGGIWRQVA